jgi:hypothetical protein
MKKKWLVRAAVALGVCVATLLITVPAMAMWDWCGCDPVVDINGHTVSLDASIQGDTQQIHGDIVFTISVPQGTDITVVSTEPGAEIHINHGNSGYGYGSGSQLFKWSVGSSDIPVSVSVDINSKTEFNTMLVVTVDGVQVAQDQGTTRCDLECDFAIG